MNIDVNKLVENTAENSFISLMGANRNGIIELPIEKLVETDNQPFNVLDDEEMSALIEDIQINGILEPIIVTEYKEKYRILAGHRRTYAAKLAGLKTVPAILKQVGSGNEKLIITNTNLTQRKKFLPSELARAYKMQQEGFKELSAHSVRTTAQLAENNNVSKRTIQYYLKLNNLIFPLLNLVDKEVITVKAGSVLSNISKNDQKTLSNFIESNGVKKLDLNYATPIWHQCSNNNNISFEYLYNLFFPKKENELKYETYIVNSSTIDDELFKSRKKLLLICNSEKLKNGIVLKKNDYAKVKAAQQKIEKQLELIEKIINNA